MPDEGGGFADSIMGMAGGGGAPPPGGAPPGAPPMGPGGPPGPPGGGGPGGQAPDPVTRIQAALQLLTISMAEIGLTETANKAVTVVVKAVQNLMKQSPQGRQGAAMQGAVPPQPPPGVGPTPGANVV